MIFTGKDVILKPVEPIGPSALRRPVSFAWLGDTMITKVRKYMEKYHMTDSGDEVIVGLSGGADSVCLLFLLKQLSPLMEFSLTALHVNHQLRKEADGEEAFVQELCRRWDIPCRTVSVDVKTYAAKRRLGTEEAARSLRYRAFEETVRDNGGKRTKIALAHHQNDQAETVLFHLFRGSGIKGLTGMRPVRDCYIRPLLCTSREEIEACLTEHQIDYVTDASNFDTEYARNKIRHDLLPMAEAEICRGSVAHIAQSAEITADAVDFLEQITEQTYGTLVRKTPDGCRIEKEALLKLHPYLRSAVVYEMLWRTCGRKRDISRAHVDSVLGLLKGQSGRRAELIYGIHAVLEQKDLAVIRTFDETLKKGTRKEETLKEETLKEETRLNLSGEIRVCSEPGAEPLAVTCRIFSYEKAQTIPCKMYTKWFDYDKINNCPVLRTRRAGDYFYCSGTARKKLKDYFIDEKIPLLERNRLLLIADGEHVIWVPGYRISSFYKVTEETKKVLEITISGGKENE